MYCANCGAHFDDDGKFCPVCGMKAEVEYVPETPVAYVAPQVIHQTASAPKIKYNGSVWTSWTSFASGVCNVTWFLYTIIGGAIGCFIGNRFYQPYWDSSSIIYPFVGLFIGLIIGCLIGFATICVPMILLSISKNIAITTDNTVEILKRLDRRK